MKSEEYTGPITGMRSGRWLASEDLLDKPNEPIAVTIQGVWRHTDAEMDGGRIEPEIFSLRFQGAKKEMVINATNRKTLSTLFGAVQNWAGKRVEIYVDHNVKQFGGGRGNGLRIRAKAIPQSITEATKSQ